MPKKRNPIPKLTPENIRCFFDKINKNKNGCWDWTGTTDGRGYPKQYLQRRARFAHRISFLIFNGSIDDTMEIDHTCRNKTCVNPAHLDQVSSRENTVRGISPAATNAKKTHCKYGHELSGENLVRYIKGRRGCRTCWYLRAKVYYKENAEKCKAKARAKYWENVDVERKRSRERHTRTSRKNSGVVG